MPGRWALPLPMAPLTPTSTAGTWWIAAVVRLAQEAARLVPHSAALLLAWVASYVPSAPVLNCRLCLTVWHPGPGPPAEPFPLERIRFVSRWGVALMRQHRGRPVASPACPTAALNALVAGSKHSTAVYAPASCRRVARKGPNWIELERPLPYDLRLQWQVRQPAVVCRWWHGCAPAGQPYMWQASRG